MLFYFLDAKVIDIILNTGTSLPSLLGDVTSTNFIEGTRVSKGLMAEISDERRHKLRLKSIGDLLGHDSLSHACSGERRDAVALDVALFTLFGQRLSEAPETKLRSCVVYLPEGAVDSGAAASVDNPAVALLSHYVPGGSCD